MLMLDLSLREVTRRPGRALLTLASVVLAVSATIAVSLGTAASRKSYEKLSALAGTGVTYEVVSDEGGTIPESVIDAVTDDEKIQNLLPIGQQPGIVRLRGKRLKTIVTGVDFGVQKLSPQIILESGAWDVPETISNLPVLLDVRFAKALEAELGTQILILTQRGLTRCEVIGLYRAANATDIMSPKVLMDLPDFQDVLGKPEELTMLRLEMGSQKDSPELLASIQARLPAGVVVRKPVSMSELSNETIRATSQGLDFIMVLCVAVAIFMLLNSFLMNIGERRKQLAIMRAIGTTRRQIMKQLLFEGLCYGILGAAIGLPLGILGARAMNAMIATMLRTKLPDPEITLQALLLAGLVGPLISLLGAYIPARSAAKIHPAEGLSGITPERIEHFPIGYAIAAVILFGCAIVGLVAVLDERIPQQWSILFGLVMLGSFLTTIPVIVAPVSRIVQWLIPIPGELEKHLAREQLLRRRTRTVLTAGVLTVAMTSGIGSGNTVVNQIQDVKDWYRRTFSGDYFITVNPVGETDDKRNNAVEGVESSIRAVAGVTHVETTHLQQGAAGGSAAMVVVRSCDAAENFPLQIEQGEIEDAYSRWKAGEIIVGTVLAKRANLQLDQEIIVETSGMSRKLKIAGIARDYVGGGLSVCLERDAAKRIFGIEEIDLFLIAVDDPQSQETSAALQEIAVKSNAVFQSFADIKAKMDSLLNGIIGAFWALLGIGFVVAGLGIINTLSMNIMEQTRDIGLMRIVGMTRMQVQKLVLIQAVLISGVGIGLGCLSGLVTAYIMQRCTEPILGYSVEFTLHPLLILGCVTAGVLIGVLAAYSPAKRAIGLPLNDALAYE